MPLDFEGDFIGKPVGFMVDVGDAAKGSKSIGINITWLLRLYFDMQAGQWVDISDHALTCDGTVWLQRKDGTLNDEAARNLASCTGWDGRFEDFEQIEWKEARVSCGWDEYQGKRRMRVQWVNDFNSPPGKRAKVDADGIQAIKNTLGPKLRAVLGNVKRNAPPAAPAPAPVASAAATAAPRSRPTGPPPPLPDDDANAPEPGSNDVPF